MKTALITIVLSSFSLLSCAQTLLDVPGPGKDSATVALEKTNLAVLIEQEATFPGGNEVFMKYVGRKILIPELTKLFGYRGRIVVGFVVDKKGAIKDIKTFSESGFGYEEQLINILKASPYWKPAVQNGRTVDQKFTIPFFIDQAKSEVLFTDLNKASYKFDFWIKDKQYDFKQAEEALGKRFSPARINYTRSFNEQSAENIKAKRYTIYIDTE